MAFPSTSVLDDFARGNASDLGGDYEFAFGFGSSANRLTVSSQRAVPSANNYGEDVRVVATYTDTEVYTTLGTVPTGSGADYGVSGRYSGTGATAAAYRLSIVHATGVWQAKAISNGSTQRNVGATVTQAVTAADQFGWRITGTGATVTIELYLNGALLATRTDTDAARIVTAGRIGLYSYNGSGGTGGALDDLGGGEVVVSDFSGGGGMAARPGRHRGRFPARGPAWF